MFDICTLKSFKNNDGLTLKKYNAINYKSGWQVATEGIQTPDAETAVKAIENFKGNCGIWFFNNIYYIDKSQRVDTKREAFKIGKAHDQLSVFAWKTQKVVNL